MCCFVDVHREGQEVVLKGQEFKIVPFRTWTSKNRIWWRRDGFGHPALFSHLFQPSVAAPILGFQLLQVVLLMVSVPRTHLGVGGCLWSLQG